MEIFMAYIWHAQPLQQSLHLFPPDYQMFSGLQGVLTEHISLRRNNIVI